MFLKKPGFSLIELLVTLALVGIISLIGFRTYRGQMDKAKSSEAQQSLAYIYSAQRQFFNAWNTYHENLIAVGAVPSGKYTYDAGFITTTTTDLSKTEGDLADYPLPDILQVLQCIDFYQICSAPESDSCLKKLETAAGDLGTKYFTKMAHCSVPVSSALSKVDSTKSLTCGKAGATEFKAFAHAKLGGTNDIWQINEKQEVKNTKDCP